jgi:hypothetical protein
MIARSRVPLLLLLALGTAAAEPPPSAAVRVNAVSFLGPFEPIALSASLSVSVTRCRFATWGGPPVTVARALFLRVKWNHFADAESARALTIAETARALIVTNNFTDLGDGAIAADNSKLEICEVRFTDLAAKEGAGIVQVDCTTVLEYSSFRRCEARRGGAICVRGGNFSMQWAIFQGNRAVNGSSIFSEDCQMVIGRSQFQEARIGELFGHSFALHDVSFMVRLMEDWNPIDSRTFSPHRTRTSAYFTVHMETPPPQDKTVLFAAVGGGVGGLILIVTIAAVWIVRARGSHNPQIYATEMSEGAPPSGTMYVTQSASRALSKTKTKSIASVHQ